MRSQFLAALAHLPRRSKSAKRPHAALPVTRPRGGLIPVPAAPQPATAPRLTAQIAALLRTGSGRHGTRPDAVVLSIINWRERFQRPQHLALQMAAAGHRVFYVNVPARRAETAAWLEAVAPNVIAINLLEGSAERFYQDGLSPEQCESYFETLAQLRTTLAIHEAFIKVDFPVWRSFAETLRKRFGWRLVYDWFEDHNDVAWRRPPSFGADADALITHSDLVIAGSEPLARRADARARALTIVPNGVDTRHFAQPMPEPHQLRALKRPILGYIGFITGWFDVAMIAEAARARPDWTFVLVGEALDVDLRSLHERPNVIFTGEQPYAQLPAFARAFDVCLIPHQVRARTNLAGSVKFFEYLSTGRPIIASPLEWLRPFHRRHLVRFAADGRALVAQAARALAADSEQARVRRQREAARHTWQRRYDTLWSAIAPLYEPASIVLVTFNNLECTRACLDSIVAHTAYPNYEVIVVDNGSTDGTVDYLRACAKQSSRVRVIVNDRNLGFAPAANIGLAAARGAFLVLLNNDTIVTPAWLGGLLSHLADERIGAVGPVTNMAGSEAQLAVSYQTIGEMPAYAAVTTAGAATPWQLVERLPMFCMAFSRAVYEAVGALDERFTIGMFEDDDYCRRIRQTGRSLACVSDVFIHHVGHASFSQLGTAKFQEIFDTNRRRFEAKWKIAWGRPAQIKRASRT
jgi:GT2 family glycosyltransferase/glycosyltransferase involved in cell wall biosynthesis